MYSVSQTHTLELTPTQETNFQFRVEWEISLPPAGIISRTNLEGLGFDSRWNVRLCVPMRVHPGARDRQADRKLKPKAKKPQTHSTVFSPVTIT